ncbi:MAG: DNA topoisomerase, partial [Lachnospiraceae bacterium]|nr:DNA topoisomerase [Lachnospiraceae bacterium]
DMSELGLRSDRPYRKSARIVGDTMGKYHPHGDSSIYDALVVMSQDFKKGAPLVDGHGNFGNIEGDGAAAMRYTEARLAKITEEAFLADLDKDVVDFGPNFDETEREPLVLPVKIPNFLINGSEGIAVGMATNTPPHNLGEVIDAMKAYMEDPDISMAKLMRLLPGPDFPTGGIVVNQSELKSIYETGQGKLRIRGKTEVEKGKSGHIKLVVTEIPYTMIGAGIGKFLLDVADLSENKLTNDIIDISNQSSKEGIRIVIELKRDTDVENFKHLLYKKTRLEDTFGVNMLAIRDGRPETLGIREILKACVEFQYEVNTRKYTNLLAKEQERREIQEGLIRACNVIDLIIEILRGSKDRAMAKDCLVEGITTGIKFRSKESKLMAEQLHFTERQADAILEMRLYRLIGLEIQALMKQHEETLAKIFQYEDILESRDSMTRVIEGELSELKKKFSRKRRTQLTDAGEVSFEIKGPEEMDAYFLMDRFGYCKLIDEATYLRNKETADAEYSFCVSVKNTGKICLFTDKGDLHTIKASDLPMGKFRDKGIPIDNVSNYESGKADIIYAASQKSLNLCRLLFVTAFGNMKIVDGGEFDVTKRTVAATKLVEGDSLLSVRALTEEIQLLVISKAGYVLRFPIEDLSQMKKNSVGVRGMRLGKGDSLAEIHYLNPLGMDEQGKDHFEWKEAQVPYGKIKLQARDGKGTKFKG